jgi:hypothetical protein
MTTSLKMKTNYADYNDIEKEFYFHLGLLSTKFAEVETNVISILGGIITDEIFLINPIIEKNSLSQNIDLLKKVNLYKEFEQEAVQDLINRISNVRKDRNLFIHGLWGRPYQEKGEILIGCLEQKITPKMVTYGRMWASAKEHSFKLPEIISQIDELNSIIDLQNNLLKKI